jgi:uncharacterized membrane protein
MSEKEIAVIETKLDILIKDFQRFREKQDSINEGIVRHSSEESEVQAKILTTQKWHSTIGGFMMMAIVWLVTKEMLG